MLQTLHIENYALIKHMQIDFAKSFIVITGETGAGKSIILGALGLLIGERTNTSTIKNQEKKCVIEGSFNISAYHMHKLFEELDLDYEDITIVRREITPSGKSRAFVNDTPVNLSDLKKLSSKLIDIHSQHKNLELENEQFQFRFIDSFAKNNNILSAYQTELSKLHTLQKKYEAMLNEKQEQNTDFDYWKYQLDELHSAQIKENEVEELEQENRMLTRINDIQEALGNATDLFSADTNPIETLRTLAHEFKKLEAIHKPSKEFAERLESTCIELQDLEKEIYNEGENITTDDVDRLSFVADRLNTLYALQHKHGKSTNKELLLLQEELEQKTTRIIDFDDELSALEKQIEIKKEEVAKVAETLHQSRKKVIPKTTKDIANILEKLGMPYAQVQIQLSASQDFRQLGKEHISFQFSANKNIPPDNISRIASGGELSRLMLTVKYLIATSETLPTIIFDEIDTGVSGDISDKMGEMMATMAKNMQVISITHQPQIAAKAFQHWEVFKDNSQSETSTHINILDEKERLRAIAQMLSGSSVTQEALANAKVLRGI